jgi:1-acyl-sn-glycerol-3-phosphate acyltransferase
VPGKGSFIFASNHASYIDPILLGVSLCRSLNYMAREDLFKRPVFGWIMRNMHAFPVRRNKGDLGAIRESLRILGESKPLVVFPEGTRAEDENLRRAKPGVGFIVSNAGVPVVPVYIGGSFSALPRGVSTLRRSPVTVYIGKPIIFDKEYFHRKDKESYQKIADEVMAGIAGLKKTYVDKAC